MWNGEMVRESTRQSNQNTARQMEGAHRASLAKGEVGIRDRKPAPILKDFLKEDFLPFAHTRHATKLLTLRYYSQGVGMLSKSSALSGLRLSDITDQSAQDFAREHGQLSPSGINRGLRTLRRALNCAYAWGKLEKPCKVTL